jgi:nitrogen fixation/metabolism regulation signal transduction histidine kinase
MPTLLRSLFVVTVVSSFAARAEGPALTAAAASLQTAQQHFRQCQNGKLQYEFEGALARLESGRRQLEKGRRETESVRRSLESVRQRIEAAHQMKHASSAEREAKEASYQQALAAQYTAPMKALTPLMERYVAGINRYSATMEKYAAFCATGGITTASARSFVSTLEPEVVALTTDAQDFVASARKAAVNDVAGR